MKERVELAVPNKRVKQSLLNIRASSENYPLYIFARETYRSQQEDLTNEEQGDASKMNLWGFLKFITIEDEKALIDYALRGKKYVKLVVKPEEFQLTSN